jgi:uncharacterized DUF497 family protein
MEFEWDAAKHTETLRERGVGFDDGARIFAGPVLIWEDSRRKYGETRFRAVGETGGDILTSHSRGAALRRGLSRSGEPAERKRSYGDAARLSAVIFY